MPSLRTAGEEAAAFEKRNKKTTMQITEFLEQICDSKMEAPFNAPFESGGYWCATDEHIAVLIKQDVIPQLTYSHTDKSIAGLLRVERNNNMPFSAKKFAAQLTPEMIEEMDYSKVEDCPECGGEGEVECPECGHEHECPKCDGDGTIGRAIPTGKMIPNPQALFQFEGVGFKYKYLSQIPVLAEIMGTDTVYCRNIDQLRSAVFVIGSAELFIMPVTGPIQHLPRIKVEECV